MMRAIGASIRQRTNLFSKGTERSMEMNPMLATADTNFSTALAPLCNLSPGPNYLIIQAGQNDLDAGATFATIRGHLQSIWAKAHAAGCKVIQGSIVPAKYGSDLTNALIVNNAYLNEWLPTQAQSFTNIASGQYYDQFVDYNAYMMYTSAGVSVGNTRNGSLAG